MHSTPMEGDNGRVFTIFDPINRKPYQLRESDLEYTVGYKNLREQQGSSSKRVFLCKNYQSKGCRAQKRCNSIHANKQVIAQLRELFPATEDDRASEILLNAKDKTTGIPFQVPKDRTTCTAGSAEANSRAVLVCTDYDEEQACPDGEACPFLHIEASFMRHVRIMWRVPCCVSCTGMKHDFPPLGEEVDWESFVVGSRTDVMPRCFLSLTKGLRELCVGGGNPTGVLYIPPPRVCRPHQRMACKWGADCSNVHICRQQVGGRRRSCSSSSSTTPKHSECDTASVPCLSPGDHEAFRLTPPLDTVDFLQPLPSLVPSPPLALQFPSTGGLTSLTTLTPTPSDAMKEPEMALEGSPSSPFSPSAFSLLTQLQSFQSLHIPLGGISFSGCM